MLLLKDKRIILTALAGLMLSVSSGNHATEDYVQWQKQGLAIAKPLTHVPGDPARGRALVIDRHKGNCLACHAMPIPEEPFHGSVGPSLIGVASRLSMGQLRLRVVDEKQINPMSIMPGYYRHPSHFNQVLAEYEGKTLLSAQEVEDVVAYLSTLR